jgi:hypothetical protein
MRQIDQSRTAYSVVPASGSGREPALVGAGAGAGLGAGAGAAGAGAGAACGAGLGATLRAVRFFAFAAVRLGARLATTFLLAFVARFFARAADFSTRFFVFALVFDLALLLAFADRFVFAFLAMRVAPLLQSLNRTDSSGHVANLRDPLMQASDGTRFLGLAQCCAQPGPTAVLLSHC